jgi:hypothetical protein
MSGNRLDPKRLMVGRMSGVVIFHIQGARCSSAERALFASEVFLVLRIAAARADTL